MYISHGHSLLTEKGADSIVIKAVGRALNKAVTAAEILKRRIEGLHQVRMRGSDFGRRWKSMSAFFDFAVQRVSFFPPLRGLCGYPTDIQTSWYCS